MFKRIATSVKTAIQSSKQTQQKQKSDDDSEIQTDCKVVSIRERKKLETELGRKNHRSKLVNVHRVNNLPDSSICSSANSTASSGKATHGSAMKKANSDMDLSKCNYSTSENTSERRQKLEDWRKNRHVSKTTSMKDIQKPVFKVQHLSSRFFDSKSMSDLGNQSKNVKKKHLFPFNLSFFLIRIFLFNLIQVVIAGLE